MASRIFFGNPPAGVPQGITLPFISSTAVLYAPSLVVPARTQLWMSRAQTPSTSAATYWPPVGGVPAGVTPSGTEANVRGVITSDGGTLKSLWVRLTAAPGVGKSWRVRVYINGVADGDLDLTISDADTSDSVTIDVALAGGDSISIECTPSGGPAAADVHVTLEYEPTTLNYFQYPTSWGYGENRATIAESDTTLLNTSDRAQSFPDRNVSVMPFDGTIREVYIELTSAPGASKSRNIHLYINGVDTVTWTLTGSGAGNRISDNTGLAIAVAAGDRLALVEQPAGVPSQTRIRMGLVIEPDTAGVFALVMSSSNAHINVSGDHFVPPSGGGGAALLTTESNAQALVSRDMSISALWFTIREQHNTVAETLTARVRKNGASTSVLATLDDSNQQDAHDIAHTSNFEAGDLLSILITSPGSDGDMDDWSIGLAASLVFVDPDEPQDITLPLLASTAVLYEPSLGGFLSSFCVAVGHGAAPYISVYRWDETDGLSARYAPPSPSLSSVALDPNFHPSSTFICFVAGGELYVFPWDMVTGYGTRIANPGTMPANLRRARWSPNGQVLMVAHADSPYVSAYRWSAAGFGTKYAAPAQTPSGPPHHIAWHPDSTAFGVCFNATPWFFTWAWDMDDGFGSRYAAPKEATHQASSLDWHPSGDFITCGFSPPPRQRTWAWGPGFSGDDILASTPASTVYDLRWNVDGLALAAAIAFGTPNKVTGSSVVAWAWDVDDSAFEIPYAPPATLPGTGPGAFSIGVAWHPEGTDIVVASDGEPYLQAYPWTFETGFGTKYPDPAELPEADTDPDTWPPPVMVRPAWGGTAFPGQNITLPLIASTATLYSIRVGNVIELPLLDSTAVLYGIALEYVFDEGTELGTTGETLEIEFVPGVWTDVSDYFDSTSALDWRRGVGPDREPYVGTMSFDLSNHTEDFTTGRSEAPWWNKLLPGIGVRYIVTYQGIARPRFRGTITDIIHSYGTEGTDDHRVAIECEAMSGLLARTSRYYIATMSAATVDAALTAIMEAPQFEIDGATAVLYSFEPSSMVLPYFWSRGNALADAVAAAQCDLGGVLWEDGSGQLRFTRVASLVGKYHNPAHTWGTVVSPEGEVKPDWRWTSQIARQAVQVQIFDASVGDIDLYTHPYNADNGLSIFIPAYQSILITFQFDTIPLTVYDFGAGSVITGNGSADGSGWAVPGGVNAHMYLDGISGRVLVNNGGNVGFYLIEMVIRGTGLIVSAQGAPVITYERPIPYIAGVPEGDPVNLPYMSYSQAAAAYCQSLLRSGRVPTPWLELEFVVSTDEIARSLHRAEINDLVLYEGTGTWREQIREWYRIQSIECHVEAKALTRYRVQLSPAHMIRDPYGCAQSSFLQPLDDLVKLEIGGQWTQSAGWREAEGRCYSFLGGATPDPATKDIGSGDQVVIVKWNDMSQATYSVTNGGVGCCFRSNGDGSERWEARFDPDDLLIEVWNTEDGVVASYPWTPVDAGELEVRAMSDRIRVYLNARPEPIIDLPARSRYQSNTHAGLIAKYSGGDVDDVYCSDFYAQAV